MIIVYIMNKKAKKTTCRANHMKAISAQKKGFYEKSIKRLLDIICGIRVDGRETIFKMYKFRSMTDARDENRELHLDEMRLTLFGKWMREISLDELGGVINIISSMETCLLLGRARSW